MRIGLIAGFGWEGGRLYMEGLGRALLRVLEPTDELIWFHEGNVRPHPELRAKAICIPLQAQFHGPRGLASLVGEASLLAQVIRHKVDVLYPSRERRYLPATCVAWIPDFQHKRLPEMFQEKEIKARDRSFRRTLRRARRVVVSSKDAQNDLAIFYPKWRSKSRVLNFSTPLAENDFEVDAKGRAILADLPKQFAYAPNQFWKHKGHETLFLAWAQQASKGNQLPLLCTGSHDDYRHPDWFRHLHGILGEHGLKDKVRFLGFVPRGAQLHIIEKCKFLVHPSRFEGWSTVVEDARALNCRIVLSDLKVHLEQNPQRAHWARVGDVDSLARACSEAAASQEELGTREESIAAAAVHSKAVGAELLKILREAL